MNAVGRILGEVNEKNPEAIANGIPDKIDKSYTES